MTTDKTEARTLLRETADQVAVVDALYRFAAGIDLGDDALLASALTDDAVSDFGPAAAKAGFSPTQSCEAGRTSSPPCQVR